MINSNFVILGFAINMIGSFSYIWHTLQGKTRPNRVTWFLWALAPLIAFSAQLDEGVGIQALQTFAVGLGPALIFVASFVNRKSVWKITRFDMFCGSLSVLALILWMVTGHGAVAIVLSILADGFAALPTVVKSWQEPTSESSTVFLLAGINAIITLLTIQHFSLENSAFAIYILCICAILYALIRFKLGPRLKSRTA